MRKNVLITGASGGIGSSLALAFAERGYGVAMQYHSREQAARETAERICSGGGTAEIFSADISREDEVEALFDAAESRLGFLGVLVNNAAISQKGLFTDLTLGEWNRIFAVNCTGAFLCSRRVLPEMIRRKEGCILNISSMWGQVGGFLRGGLFRLESGADRPDPGPGQGRGAFGNPGELYCSRVIGTAMNADLSEEDWAALREETPLGRIGTPEEVAQAALLLAENRFITGQTLGVNGGFVI